MALYSFDETFYLTNNPDVVTAIAQGAFVSAEQHYLLYGEAEGRRPNAEFDPQYYYSQNPDVLNAGLSALEHFEMFGLAEGRQPSEQVPYNEAAYLAANQDVADAVAAGTFASGWQHYVFFGSAEGRSPDGDGTAITGDTFVLTSVVDDFSGGSANDLFLGVTGSQDTLTVGDNLDGGGGSDVVRIFTDGDEVNLALANVANIENLEVQSRSDGLDWINVNDLGGAFRTFLADFGSITQADDLEVERIAANTAVTLQNGDFGGDPTIAGDGSTVDFYLNEQADGINGYMRLSNIDDADVFVEVDASGNGSAADDVYTVVFDGVTNTEGDMDWYIDDVETLNVVVDGDSALENFGNYYNNDGSAMGNTVVNLTANADLHVGFWDFNDDAGATQNTTFNITGAGNVTIDDVDDGTSNMTIAAGAATGNVTLLGLEPETVSVTTGDGNDTVEISSIDTAVIVGMGDDKVIVGADIDDASALDGAEGTDTLSLTAAKAVTGTTTAGEKLGTVFQNFEVIELSTGLNGALDMANLDTIQSLVLAAGVDGASSVAGLTTGATIENQEDGGLALTVSGTQAELTYIVNAATSTFTTLLAAGADTLNIESTTTDDDPASVSNDVHLDGTAHTTINVTGDVELVLDHIDLTSVETVSAGSFDAGLGLSLWGNTNDVTVTVGDGDNWIDSADGDDTITTGAGDDEIYGNLGNDTIVAGDGANYIEGGTGLDTLTGGADVDTFGYAAASDSQGVAVDVITNFDVTEDILDFSALALIAPAYVGEANGYGAVLTSLAIGSSNAVLDSATSILYLDVNADAILDNSDLAIELTGVTDLSVDNFLFV